MPETNKLGERLAMKKLFSVADNLLCSACLTPIDRLIDIGIHARIIEVLCEYQHKQQYRLLLLAPINNLFLVLRNQYRSLT